jgi:ABC-type sugar transport system permease subunit
MGKNSYKKFQQKQKLFYASIVILPLIQLAIFYFYVNFKSFLLSFQEFSYDKGRYVFVGLSNLKTVITDMTTQIYFIVALKNSLLILAVNLLVGCTIPLLFSYYIYKKRPLGGLFKVILFLPSIISGITMVVLYKYMVVNALPEIIKSIFDVSIGDLLGVPQKAFYPLLFFSLFTGFGSQIILYIGAMSAVSEATIEASEIDGFSYMQQFLYIVFPLIWPTFATFVVILFAGTFTNQLGLFQFYAEHADPMLYTYGYYLYRNVIFQTTTIADYPYLAGIGLVLTLVTIPVTLSLRYFLFKYGPSTD